MNDAPARACKRAAKLWRVSTLASTAIGTRQTPVEALRCHQTCQQHCSGGLSCHLGQKEGDLGRLLGGRRGGVSVPLQCGML